MLLITVSIEKRINSFSDLQCSKVPLLGRKGPANSEKQLRSSQTPMSRRLVADKGQVLSLLNDGRNLEDIVPISKNPFSTKEEISSVGE